MPMPCLLTFFTFSCRYVTGTRHGFVFQIPQVGALATVLSIN
jgi:hypothetical protein